MRLRKSVELRETKKRIKRIETKLREGNRETIHDPLLLHNYLLKSQKKKLNKLKKAVK